MVDKTFAEDFLNNFPCSIPYSESVKKYNVEKAENCLIYIKQLHPNSESMYKKLEHLVDPETAQEIQDFYSNYIQNSQNNIYEIVKHLRAKNGIYDFFAEGIKPKHEPVFKFLENTGGLLRKLNRIRDNFGLKHEEHMWCKDKISDLEAKLKETSELSFVFNKEKYAPARLAYEGIIEVYAAEYANGNPDALVDKIADKNTPSGKAILDIKSEMELREYNLVEHIANKNIPVAVTAFGMAHDFWKTINKWNKSNKNQMFNLIEIEPKDCISETHIAYHVSRIIMKRDKMKV